MHVNLRWHHPCVLLQAHPRVLLQAQPCILLQALLQARPQYNRRRAQQLLLRQSVQRGFQLCTHVRMQTFTSATRITDCAYDKKMGQDTLVNAKKVTTALATVRVHSRIMSARHLFLPPPRRPRVQVRILQWLLVLRRPVLPHPQVPAPARV